MIRIIFTSESNRSRINNNELFKWIGYKYLEEFPVEWAGYIAMDATITGRMEPSWQFIVENDELEEELLNYIQNNELPTYAIRILTKGEL